MAGRRHLQDLLLAAKQLEIPATRLFHVIELGLISAPKHGGKYSPRYASFALKQIRDIERLVVAKERFDEGEEYPSMRELIERHRMGLD